MNELPLALGDVSPGPDFKRMGTTIRPDGLYDGLHCGGAWLTPDELEVWKPLDARPYPNAGVRYPTDEDRCLTEMAGKPGFPLNWRVEERNGRRWLVRPRCYLWPQDKDVLPHPELEVFLMVEEALRAMNAAGWEYGDLPQLAYDPTISEWFLLDCSAAFKPDKWQMDNGDEWRIPRWFELMGLEWLARLRRRGRHLANVIQMPLLYPLEARDLCLGNCFYPCSDDEQRRYRYIYASRNRPMSALWARIPKPEHSKGVRYIDGEMGKWPVVYTWAVSDFALDDETIFQYELTLAYRPWLDEREAADERPAAEQLALL